MLRIECYIPQPTPQENTGQCLSDGWVGREFGRSSWNTAPVSVGTRISIFGEYGRQCVLLGYTAAAASMMLGLGI